MTIDESAILAFALLPPSEVANAACAELMAKLASGFGSRPAAAAALQERVRELAAVHDGDPERLVLMMTMLRLSAELTAAESIDLLDRANQLGDEVGAPLGADVEAALALLHGPLADDEVLRRYVVATALLGAEAREGTAWAIRRRASEVPPEEVVDYAILAADVLSGEPARGLDSGHG
jgi:hypothetical protein